MSLQNDTWTPAHDLALVYIALAYGTDHDLTDDELTRITETLRVWRDDAHEEATQEVVMEDSQIAAALSAQLAERIGTQRFELWFGAHARLAAP